MRRARRGFSTQRFGDARVLAVEEIASAAQVLGLHEPWRLVRPRPPGPGTGRGPVGTLRPAQGPPLFVKQALRGGLPARLNRERYFLTGRFRRELEVGLLARRAGLPVAETLAVTLLPARPGWRAWTASRLVDESLDLARALGEPGLGAAARREVLGAAARAVVATHDAGLEHRDLNLGNVVVRPCGAGAYEAFIVDLDRARWSGRPLRAARRRAAAERLARSWRRIFADSAPVKDADRDALLVDPVALGRAAPVTRGRD